MKSSTDPNDGAAPALKHPLDEAEAAFDGGRKEFAKWLGVTPAAVGNWKARGEVPVKACVRIERRVPTVTRQRLRPVDYHEIWPDIDDRTAGQQRELSLEVVDIVERRRESSPVANDRRRRPEGPRA